MGPVVVSNAFSERISDITARFVDI